MTFSLVEVQKRYFEEYTGPFFMQLQERGTDAFKPQKAPYQLINYRKSYLYMQYISKP